MPAEEKSAGRERIASVMATAAITVAIGVTVAALGGYLTPSRSGGASTEAQRATPGTMEAARATNRGAPSVVLVPVAPDAQQAASTMPTPGEPATRVARYEEDEPEHADDHDRGREHDEHEDDHDDD